MMSQNLIVERFERAPRRGVELYRPRTRVVRALQGALLACALPLAAGCSSFNLYSEQQDIELGTAAFQEVQQTEKILTSGPQVEQVRRVTDRLIVAAKELDPEIAGQFPWEVSVIDDPNTANAFCLPGGKMAVYTGILAVTQDDTGLAVVMGHEIAHATQRHGTERLTVNMPIQTAIQIFAQDENQAAIGQVLAQLGVGLPWSRSNELEADRVGLMYMAKAGYDPREAPGFWERMAEMSGGAGEGVSEWFSTHPANSTRIEQIRELLPEALPLYEGQKKQLAPQP
jgi:predicted Zn-dependent protease